jgi:hypothetical protein
MFAMPSPSRSRMLAMAYGSPPMVPSPSANYGSLTIFPV